MKWWVVLIVVAVVGGGYLALRALSYSRHLRERQVGFTRIQHNAFQYIGTASERQDVRAPTDAELEGQVFQTCAGLSLAYTIERDGGEYVHHVSAKAPGRSRKFVIDEMLLVMADLMVQFKACGFSENSQPKFDIAESDLGTQHLEFRLSQAQHEALAAVIAKP